MKIQVRNLQKVKKIKAAELRKKVKRILTALRISNKTLNIVLCENCIIRNLNKNFLHKNYATDVISFPLESSFPPGVWGEIVVSVEQAVNKCGQYSLTWEEELFLYIIHGILHLIGYDHRTVKDKRAMQRKEKELLALIYPKSE